MDGWMDGWMDGSRFVSSHSSDSQGNMLRFLNRAEHWHDCHSE